MMKKLVVAIFIFLFAVSAVFPVFAHSGGTDGAGGHYNHSTGEYHYHHGHPAHQHENGVCPYNYVDKTGQVGGNGNTGDDYYWLIIVIPAVIVAIILLVRRCKKEAKDGKCHTLGGIAVITLTVSALSFFFSLFIFVVMGHQMDDAAELLIVATVSALVFVISLSVLKAVSNWEKNHVVQKEKLLPEAKTTPIPSSAPAPAAELPPLKPSPRQALPDFKMYYTKSGGCYHSTPQCPAIKNAVSVNWGTKDINFVYLTAKRPCPKCCTNKNGKIIPQKTNSIAVHSQTAPAAPVHYDQNEVEMKALVSSNLESAGYFNGVLLVRFHNGSVYQYSNVPEPVYAALFQASSPGKYFNAYIRDSFDSQYIGDK